MLAIVLLQILTGAAFAQSQPNVTEILNRVNSTYQNLGSFHFEAQYINEERRDGVTIKSESKRILAHDSQERVRVEFKNPNFEFIKLFDGKTMWTYFPGSKQYSGRMLESPNSLAQGPSVDFMITASITSDIYSRYAQPESDWPLLVMDAMLTHPDETIVMGDRKIPVYVIEIQYSLTEPDGGELRRTLWIDQSRFIVLRELAIREEIQSDKMIEMRTLINLTTANIGDALPKNLFTFKPPPGARQVEFPSAHLKKLDDLDILPKAIYGTQPNAVARVFSPESPGGTPSASPGLPGGVPGEVPGEIPKGVPGGVGIPSAQETMPQRPGQSKKAEIQLGKPIKQVYPDYPAILWAFRVSGTVEVWINIDVKGIVTNASMIRGFRLFQGVSEEAARQWRFEPTLLNGVPVTARRTLIFTFPPQRKR